MNGVYANMCVYVPVWSVEPSRLSINRPSSSVELETPLAGSVYVYFLMNGIYTNMHIAAYLCGVCTYSLTHMLFSLSLPLCSK